MTPVPRINIEDLSIQGLSCAICGAASLSVVHLDQFPDYVSCANCASAFVMEAEGERVMYGSIPVEYPQTSHFALQQWTWLEAVERRARPERTEDPLSEIPSEFISTEKVDEHPPAAQVEEIEPEVPGDEADKLTDSELTEAQVETQFDSEDSMDFIDDREEAPIEPPQPEEISLDEKLEVDLEEGLVEDLSPDIGEDIESPVSDVDFKLPASEVKIASDDAPITEDGAEIDFEAPAPTEPDMVGLKPEVHPGSDPEFKERIQEDPESAIPIPAYESSGDDEESDFSEKLVVESALEGETDNLDEMIPKLDQESRGEADAVFSEEWLDGVVAPQTSEPDSTPTSTMEGTEEADDSGAVPLGFDAGEAEPSVVALSSDEEMELDSTAWLDDYTDFDLSKDEADTAGILQGADEPEPESPDERESYFDSTFGEETLEQGEDQQKKEAVIAGGIEVTEDFEQYAGVMPFDESVEPFDDSQTDQTLEGEQDAPLPVAERYAKESIDGVVAAEAAVSEGPPAEADLIKHVEPPPGTRYRVILRRATAKIPYGICAHCMRSPATNELIIIDPWGIADSDKKQTDYTLFLCPACYKRARTPSDEERNARITAFLISGLVALTIVVFGFIVGLVNFQENPLVDAIILTILGVIGFLIPAMILLNRANRFPPPTDAAYVRSTLFIPPTEDESEVAFEWRNAGFAERFAESNYELMLGKVTEVPDQAPGIRDSD